MNEFIARKVGEVLAFCQVSQETLLQEEKGLIDALGRERLGTLAKENEQQTTGLIGFAQSHGLQTTAEATAAKTSAKLRAMRDSYIGEQSAEILEWLGFFEGAAIMHWNLVQGAAEKLHNFELLSLTQQGLEFHNNFFKDCLKAVKANGAQQASS